jgi:hypothetical protein
LLSAAVANSLTIFTDVYTYGFNGTNSTSSIFSPNNTTIFSPNNGSIFSTNNGTIFNLTSPTLNISAFYISALDIFSFPNALIVSGSSANSNIAATEALSYPSLARFARIDQPDNRTYDIPYIRNNGRCLPQNTYQWGFSFLLLFIALLFSTLWALGMWAMWLDAYYNSKIDAVGERDMGSWRAVMDLAEAFAASLNSDGIRGQDPVANIFAGTKEMGNGEIRRRIGKGSKRGEIGYVNLVCSDKAVITRSVRLRIWLERRRWGCWLLRWRRWVIAATIVVVLLIGVVFPVSISAVRWY